MTAHVLTASLDGTIEFARRLAGAVRDRPSTLIGLSGDLGAGKTTFVQAFVKALAPDEEHFVTSPTFAIVQSYDTEPPVTHMDLYRLSTLADLEAIGYRDHYFASGVTLVEWVDRVPAAFPPEWIEVQFTVLPSEMRSIRVQGHGDRLDQVVNEALGGPR
jgi:tRNA threonylcarbamoyladenosine biosynthesis protein TsaE